jgi:hypothetical protein
MVNHGRARHNNESLLLWKAVLLLPPPLRSQTGVHVDGPRPRIIEVGPRRQDKE